MSWAGCTKCGFYWSETHVCQVQASPVAMKAVATPAMFDMCIDWRARAEAAEARVRELESCIIGHHERAGRLGARARAWKASAKRWRADALRRSIVTSTSIRLAHEARERAACMVEALCDNDDACACRPAKCSELRRLAARIRAA